MLDVVQTGGLLDRSRTGAFDFSRLFKCGSLATFRVEKRPYDDVTGHLKVDNALHPSFLPGRVLPTFQKLQKWPEPKSEGWAMRCQGVVRHPTPPPP